MNNNSYIQIIEKRNGDYKVFLITRKNDGIINKRIFKDKDALIMVKTTAKHQDKLNGEKTSKDTTIYKDVKKVMYYFKKEKIRNKKINRIKSRTIATSIALVASISVGASLTTSLSTHADPTVSSTNIEPQIEDNTIELNNEQIITLEYNEPIDEEVKVEDNPTYSEPITDNNLSYVESNHNSENAYNFEYYSEEINDQQAFENASKYMDIFKECEAKYGIDANLLCAIAAQESSGIHHDYSVNGAAIGLMGIENIWDGATITAFNFETNSYETMTIDYSKLKDVYYNIVVGAIINQINFYSTINNKDDIDTSEQMAFALQEYNMGPGNMDKILSVGPDWMGNRDILDQGDPRYIEHVLTRLENDTTITIRLPDGSYHTTTITNKALENNHTL